MKHFDYQIIDEGFKQITLKYNDEKNETVVKIAPEKGSNMFKYKVNNLDLIYYDPELPLDHYLNGNPIIYPLPNRVNNCHYKYKGESYWQEKNKKPIFLHSLVYDEKWDFKEPEIKADHIELKTFLSVNEEHPVYEGFPFKHKIIIKYKLFDDRLRLKYFIENHDEKELPYGLCFHTYFNYLVNRDNTYLKIPAKHYMELNKDQIPTGNLISTLNSEYDFNNVRSLKEVNLDGALTNLKESPKILYKDRLKINFDYSKEFTHVQLYTPLNKPFFCLEMQTCSADAHNLAAEGKEEAAHLLSVKPGGKSSGWLDYKPKLC